MMYNGTIIRVTVALNIDHVLSTREASHICKHVENNSGGIEFCRIVSTKSIVCVSKNLYSLAKHK